MEGRREAERRDFERDIMLAWHVEAFAREKRLKPLAQYIGKVQQKRKQSPAEMLTAFQDMKAAGAPIRIRRVA